MNEVNEITAIVAGLMAYTVRNHCPARCASDTHIFGRNSEREAIASIELAADLAFGHNADVIRLQRKPPNNPDGNDLMDISDYYRVSFKNGDELHVQLDDFLITVF